ncbi:MAG TPA: hypothetical protein PK777_08475, partial [Thermoguttaceae bacterium]|nr:hypothetical protein [Thermoguttaceae bacterium]
PIAGNWTGAGLTWAPPWASFTAHVGMPTLALALLGSAAALVVGKERRQMAVWAGLTLAVLIFVLLAPRLMPVWNPRYSLLWVLPLWITGALAVETVGAALVQWACPSAEQARDALAGKNRQFLSGILLLGCYGCVALLLAPKWASHWIDGTRHDYRQAASLVVQWLQEHRFLFGPVQPSPENSPLPSAGEAGERSSPGEGDKKALLVSLFPPLPSSKPDGSEQSRSDLPATIPILTNMELQMRYYLPKALRSQADTGRRACLCRMANVWWSWAVMGGRGRSVCPIEPSNGSA